MLHQGAGPGGFRHVDEKPCAQDSHAQGLVKVGKERIARSANNGPVNGLIGPEIFLRLSAAGVKLNEAAVKLEDVVDLGCREALAGQQRAGRFDGADGEKQTLNLV